MLICKKKILNRLDIFFFLSFLLTELRLKKTKIKKLNHKNKTNDFMFLNQLTKKKRKTKTKIFLFE